MANKPRSDARYQQLSLEQQDQVASWILDEAHSYRDAIDRVKKEFGVEFTTASMGTLYREVCVPRKLRRSTSAANSVAELTTLLNTDFDKANGQLLGQQVFEMLSNPDTDPQAVGFLASSLEKYKGRLLEEKKLEAKIAESDKKFEQKDREIRLAVDKFQFDAIKAAIKHAAEIKTISANRSLDADQKAEQMRRLLFPQAFNPEVTA